MDKCSFGLSRGARPPLVRARAKDLFCAYLVSPLRTHLEGRLTAAHLKRELRRIAYGQARLAQKLGVNPSEVRHWLAGDDPVPAMVALDIRNLPSHNGPPPV